MSDLKNDKIQWLNNRSLFLVSRQSREVPDDWQIVTRPISMESLIEVVQQRMEREIWALETVHRQFIQAVLL